MFQNSTLLQGLMTDQNQAMLFLASSLPLLVKLLCEWSYSSSTEALKKLSCQEVTHFRPD